MSHGKFAHFVSHNRVKTKTRRRKFDSCRQIFRRNDCAARFTRILIAAKHKTIAHQQTPIEKKRLLRAVNQTLIVNIKGVAVLKIPTHAEQIAANQLPNFSVRNGDFGNGSVSCVDEKTSVRFHKRILSEVCAGVKIF